MALELRRGAQLPESERARVFEQHRSRLDEVLGVIDWTLEGREVLVGGSSPPRTPGSLGNKGSGAARQFHCRAGATSCSLSMASGVAQVSSHRKLASCRDWLPRRNAAHNSRAY
ncbi:hypothetical protein MEBOL_005740 [Melittangium boletus DSM 14713]|uniref:Uncharacterized protein n=1 Tax=Melittangium boletus DSM 14713 TaxID=1294270 RepID=A0A250ILY7_9BACT|nr:hypothetical protein MEBOL_005740 [Melittangium boletus DSM 14713]